MELPWQLLATLHDRVRVSRPCPQLTEHKPHDAHVDHTVMLSLLGRHVNYVHN